MHCFITCDYIPNSRKIMLYTLPVCHTHFVYHIDLKKISLSNFNDRITHTDMDNVRNLDLNMTKDMKILSVISSRMNSLYKKNRFMFRSNHPIISYFVMLLI
jgi:hypothetical protein